MSQDPREHWNQQAAVYASDEGHRRFGRFLDLYEESCWRYIEPVLPRVDTGAVLEAGCGAGRWVMRLAPMGYRVALSDLSPEMVERAREKTVQLGLSDRVIGCYALDICDMRALPDASFDLVLALGGPLSLCHDAGLAIREFLRVTRPGGYVVCDVANRYRTALELARATEGRQLASLLDTGQFVRRDGLVDHRFDPQELAHLFTVSGWAVTHMAGICPFFEYLPAAECVSGLDDPHFFEAMRSLGQCYAENLSMSALSGRLLVVARKG